MPLNLTNEEVIAFQKKIREDPVWFAEKVLKKPLWGKEKEILLALRDNKEVAVRSSNATGKSFTAARAVHWWLLGNTDSIVITTAPCFDKETEILTNNGWKKFSSLKDEKVAQYNNGWIEFVKPLEYHKYPFRGELIGYKSQLIDMLVTPNHRLYVSNKWNKKPQIKFAEDLYGKWNWNFHRTAKYKGNKHKLSNDWFEFYGFWFAEGYCERSVKKNRVVVTQKKNIEYVDDLFNRIGLSNKVKKNLRQNGAYNWTIYDKTMATEFIKYGKSLTKQIPRWILNASPEQLRSFYKGFLMGDGSIDKNGSEKLCTSSKQMANDLHEICIKLGMVANLRTYKNKKSTNGELYEIKIWHKRGKTPQTHGRNWYKQKYNDYVYCVKVPTQLIIVRRNGKVHISGNTFRQVKEILWREIKDAVAEKPLYPRNAILETKINIDDRWFALGISTNKPDQFQGFHSSALLVILDEASGINDIIFEAVDGLKPDRILMIGNPLRNTGRFAQAFKRGEIKKIHISSFDTPNLQASGFNTFERFKEEWEGRKLFESKIIIPGLITLEDVIKFANQYGIDSDVFRVRVLGEFPQAEEDSFISISEIEGAINREVDVLPQWEKKMGVDPARYGSDRTAFVVRQMEKVVRKEVYTKIDTMAIAGLIIKIAKEEKIKPENINLDIVGIGAGIKDRLREQGWDINGVNVALPADDTEHYANQRAELGARVKEWLKTGQLPKDDDFYEAANIKYKFTSKGQMLLESKEDMKKRGLPSPDVYDALCLTFATRKTSTFNMPEEVGGAGWDRY